MEVVQTTPSLFPHVPCPTPPKDILLLLAAQWRDLHAARGCEASFSAERYMQLCWVLDATGYELSDAAVQIAIGRKAREDGASARTCGKYLAAAKSFSKWLARPSLRALPFDPLSELRAPSTKRDKRHVRTTFWPVFEKLLTTVEGSKRLFQGIPGRDRAELYHAAAATGLREGTLTVVEVGQFHFEQAPAFVHVRADQVKDGEELVVPIQADSAARLAAYLAGKIPTMPAFRTPRKPYDFARMLRKDLADAGIEYCRRVPLGNGRSRREDVRDFHALRHTFASWCANNNVALTTTQAWMGHSTSDLTSRHYVHHIPADQAAALSRLPPLPGVKRAS